MRFFLTCVVGSLNNRKVSMRMIFYFIPDLISSTLFDKTSLKEVDEAEKKQRTLKEEKVAPRTKTKDSNDRDGKRRQEGAAPCVGPPCPSFASERC